MCSLIAVKAAHEGKRVWWVAPTYTIAMLGFREAARLAKQMPFPVTIQPGAMQILFPGDGFIRYKSSEIPENLRGEGLDLLIMDEADFQPEEVWQEVLRPALADREGAAIFISTPNIENGWFHKMWLLGQTGQDPDVKSWQFSSYTNPYIDPAEIDRAKESLPSIVFRREFMAEFVSGAGARVRREWLKYEDHAPLQDLKIALGVDLAISEKATADYTAACVLGRDATGNLHVLEVARTRASFSQQIEFIKQLAAKWQPAIVGIEDVQYQKAMVQQISAQTSLNVRGIRPDRDKVSRFAPLEGRYELGQVWHVRGLDPAFESELLSFPKGTHDDFEDAMSIAFAVLDEFSRAAPICFVDSIDGPTVW
jgi:predicted phage terminase large subunit-like protein